MEFAYVNRGNASIGNGCAVVPSGDDGCSLPSGANAAVVIGLSGDGPIAPGGKVPVMLSGSVMTARLAAGQSVAMMATLGVANQDGHLRAWLDGAKVAKALQACDNSDGSTYKTFKVQVL